MEETTPSELPASSAMAGGSLFGSGQPATESTTTLEREATDLNLEIVTIDKMYDLTLIVGTPEPPMRQKAFRVNKGSFRNASEVWTAMLSGNWVESDLSEISFRRLSIRLRDCAQNRALTVPQTARFLDTGAAGRDCNSF
jgi:hypothetical protein